MKRVRLSLGLALAATLAVAQEPATGRIEGRVVNAVTGEPMVDIDLRLRALTPGTIGLNVVSDDVGRFVFDEMQPGEYELTAQRQGLAREAYRKGTLKLTPGQVLADIEFRLTPLGVISGVVVDGEEKPLTSVTVAAREVGATQTPLARATTDAAGQFRLTGLAPARYLLAAVPPMATGKQNRKEEQPLVTYYPSGIEEVEAVPLEVRPGQELSDLRITLRKGRLFRVQGKVVAGSPDLLLKDVILALVRRGGVGATSLASTLTPAMSRASSRSPAPDGSFDLEGVPPGSYELRATAMGSGRVRIVMSSDGSDPQIGGMALLGRLPVEVTDTDITGLVLSIGKPLRLQGTLRMEGQDEADFAGTLIAVRPVDFSSGNLSAAEASSGGAFTLEDVGRDKHVVLASRLPGSAHVKSIRVGSHDVLDSGLDLTHMESAPPLEILVSPKGATVEGKVKGDEDQPVRNVRVSLVPASDRPEHVARMKTTPANGDGSFSLTGIAPGEYRLYAYHPPQLIIGVMEPGFFKPFESKAVKVTVGEGERKQVEPTVVNPSEAR